MADELEAKLDGLSEKMDANHLSIEKDIVELRRTIEKQNNRIAVNRLKLARLEGAGVVLAPTLPILAVALNAALF